MDILVKDMTCGHCAGVITKAIKSLDAAAHIDVDLNTKIVKVSTQKLDEEQIIDAIADEGYEPKVVA